MFFLVWLQILGGDLKIATGANDSVLDFGSGSGENSVEIRFVDEDDLPLANLMEHRVSKEEFYSDEQENSEEDSDDEESADEEMEPDVDEEEEEEEEEEEDWSEEINCRADVDFSEEVEQLSTLQT